MQVNEEMKKDAFLSIGCKFIALFICLLSGAKTKVSGIHGSDGEWYDLTNNVKIFHFIFGSGTGDFDARIFPSVIMIIGFVSLVAGLVISCIRVEKASEKLYLAGAVTSVISAICLSPIPILIKMSIYNSQLGYYDDRLKLSVWPIILCICLVSYALYEIKQYKQVKNGTYEKCVMDYLEILSGRTNN